MFRRSSVERPRGRGRGQRGQSLLESRLFGTNGICLELTVAKIVE
jgi:hypothetical protein